MNISGRDMINSYIYFKYKEGRTNGGVMAGIVEDVLTGVNNNYLVVVSNGERMLVKLEDIIEPRKDEREV